MKEYPVQRVAMRDENGVVRTVRLGGGSGGGKRTCRFVVGTSTAGWTEEDCDFLCDGVDDQVEINAALSALSELGVKTGTVCFLPGTYKTSGCIYVNNEDISFCGVDGKVTLEADENCTSNYNFIMVQSDSEVEISNIEIKAKSEMNVVSLQSAAKVVIRKFVLRGRGASQGIMSYINGPLIIEDSIIEGCYLSIMAGSGETETIIRRNHVSNTTEGISITGTCRVEENTIHASQTGIAIYCADDNRVEILENTVEAGWQGVKITSNRGRPHCVVKGNYMKRCLPAIQIYGAFGAKVSQNVCIIYKKYNTSSGCWIDGCIGCMITGNQFFHYTDDGQAGDGAAILLYGTSNGNVATGNMIHGKEVIDESQEENTVSGNYVFPTLTEAAE